MFKNVQKKLNSKRGFSLIELIVVIAIIGILVMMAAPRFLGYTKDAAVTAMKSDAKILSDAALLYHIDHEAWPLGAAVTLTNADNTALITVLGYADEDAVAAAVSGGTFGIYAINDAVLGDYVKGISGDYADYLLITAGEFEGDVVFQDGEEAKDGTIWFGTQLNDGE